MPIEPRRVEVTEETDALGDDAWRLLLMLPAPSEETWDRTAVFKLRRAAIDAFDASAAQDGRSLPGRTIAFVTTDDAPEEDTAPEDEPEEGEDPGRSR